MISKLNDETIAKLTSWLRTLDYREAMKKNMDLIVRSRPYNFSYWLAPNLAFNLICYALHRGLEP